MTTAQIEIFSLLGLLMVLLIWGRWRYDVVAFLALLAAAVLGLVPASEAFDGFGHPATVTVAAVLVLSRVLSQSGAIEPIIRLLRPLEKSQSGQIAGLAGLGALLSGFMNNVGTLGLMMPLALQSARRLKRPVGLLLMPLSFGTILGGLITMIGTPPNIIIANYRKEVTGEAFAMFDFTPVGLVTALAGILFVALAGWRLIPKRDGEQASLFDLEGYVTELRVTAENPHIGKTLGDLDEAAEDIDVVFIELIRRQRHFPGTDRDKELAAGDILKVEASPTELDRFIAKFGFALGDPKQRPDGDGDSRDLTLAEAVIKPGSPLEGRSLGRVRLFARRGIGILAVSRRGRPFRGRLKHFVLRPGDLLLLFGPATQLSRAMAAAQCLPLADRDIAFGRRRHAWLAGGIFATAVAAAAFGLLPIYIAFGIAIVALVLSGVLPARELYAGIEWPVVVLLGALIPLGSALERTGATGVIAEGVLLLGADLPASFLLIVVLVVTMSLSDILNNAATAVVMAPIAVSIAEGLEVSVDPFLMAVAVGASCAFLTPIGHQNNALIMGPGACHFGDYWPMGLPLEIVVGAAAVPTILWVWPL